LEKGQLEGSSSLPGGVGTNGTSRGEKGREGKGREGKGREGKGREGKGREGKGVAGNTQAFDKPFSVPNHAQPSSACLRLRGQR
jgi:hypothetical protein